MVVRVALVLLALSVLGVPRLAAAAPNPYLNQAKVFYQGLDYEKCIRRIGQAGRWKENTPADLADIELYAGLCHFQLGDEQEAAEHFQLALELEPRTQLPPYTSPRIISFFKQVAAKVRLRAKDHRGKPRPDAPVATNLDPVADPTGDAAAEAPNPESHRLTVALPIGLGAGAVVLGGVALGFGIAAKQDEKRANDPNGYQVDAQKAGQNAQREAVLTDVGFALAGAAAVAALVTFLVR